MFRLHTRFVSEDCFEMVGVDELAKHLNTYLRPAANLILGHLESILHVLDDEDFVICNFGSGTQSNERAYNVRIA